MPEDDEEGDVAKERRLPLPVNEPLSEVPDASLLPTPDMSRERLLPLMSGRPTLLAFTILPSEDGEEVGDDVAYGIDPCPSGGAPVPA